MVSVAVLVRVYIVATAASSSLLVDGIHRYEHYTRSRINCCILRVRVYTSEEHIHFVAIFAIKKQERRIIIYRYVRTVFFAGPAAAVESISHQQEAHIRPPAAADQNSRRATAVQ